MKETRNQFVSVTEVQLTKTGLLLQYHNDVKTGIVDYCLVYRDYILGVVYMGRESGHYETEFWAPPFHVSLNLMVLIRKVMRRLVNEDISGMIIELREYLRIAPQERV